MVSALIHSRSAMSVDPRIRRWHAGRLRVFFDEVEMQRAGKDESGDPIYRPVLKRRPYLAGEFEAVRLTDTDRLALLGRPPWRVSFGEDEIGVEFDFRDGRLQVVAIRSLPGGPEQIATTC